MVKRYLLYSPVVLLLLQYWSVLRALLRGRYLHKPPCQLGATERLKKDVEYLHRPLCQRGATDRPKKKRKALLTAARLPQFGHAAGSLQLD